MKDNGVVCMLAWNGMALSMKNTIRPCCRFDIGETTEELTEGFKEPSYADKFNWLRKNMLEGKETPECNLCYQQGKESIRSQANNIDFCLEDVELTEDFDKLKSIELSLDNLCNLQCKMCDSLFSSKLYYRDEHLLNKFGDSMGGKLPTKIPKNRIEYIKELDVDWQYLTKIKVLGGEPFFSPNFPTLIDFLIEKCNVENMTLEIITNATKKLQSTLVDKLNRFKKIRLIGSIDGCNTYNSYQRWGSPGFDETLTIYKEYIDQLNNVHKGHIHSTYTTLNLNGFADDMDYWATNYPNWSVSFKFVEDSEYSPYNGPDWYNDWILSEWKTNTDRLPNATKKIDMAKTILTSAPLNKNKAYDWQMFMKKMNELDKYYDSNLRDYNPELDKLLMKNEDGWRHLNER